MPGKDLSLKSSIYLYLVCRDESKFRIERRLLEFKWVMVVSGHFYGGCGCQQILPSYTYFTRKGMKTGEKVEFVGSPVELWREV